MVNAQGQGYEQGNHHVPKQRSRRSHSIWPTVLCFHYWTWTKESAWVLGLRASGSSSDALQCRSDVALTSYTDRQHSMLSWKKWSRSMTRRPSGQPHPWIWHFRRSGGHCPTSCSSTRNTVAQSRYVAVLLAGKNSGSVRPRKRRPAPQQFWLTDSLLLSCVIDTKKSVDKWWLPSSLGCSCKLMWTKRCMWDYSSGAAHQEAPG